MPLDTKKHEAQLVALSRAFNTISTKAQNTESRLYWEGQKQLAEMLELGIEDYRRWHIRTVKSFHKITEDLAAITDTLINRTSSPEGKLFWANQTASLLGLADLLSDRLAVKKQQPLKHQDRAHQN